MSKKKADNHRLSILIPVYMRYGRLYRGLLYLSKIIKDEQYKSLFSSIEFVIADGTEDEGLEGIYKESRQLVIKLIEDLQDVVRIQYTSLPGASYLQRLVWLSKQSNAEYITMQGDEDILAFDSIEKWLDELDSDPQIAAITGQYLDFKGFERLGYNLKFYLEEGWVYGVDIDQNCPKARMLQLCLLGNGGISSISYSLMRHSVFSKFASVLENNYDKYTYTGMESLLNFFQVAAGKVKIKKMPFLLRDFTFMDHSSQDQDWSDAVKDSESFLMSLRAVNEIYSLFSSNDEINQYFNYLLEVRKLGAPLREELHRLIMNSAQPSLIREVRKKINPSTMKALTESWKSTLRLCYSTGDIAFVAGFLQLSPRKIARKISRKLQSAL